MSTMMSFSLRVRLGQCEVEISGSKVEVLQTVKDLPNLVSVISEAFSRAQMEGSQTETGTQSMLRAPFSPQLASPKPAYPSIQSTGGCADAVVRLLGTEWGRLAPRTLPEIVEAMRVNAVHYPVTTLSGVLNWLVRKGRVKRWKTEKGYVYILAQITTSQYQTSTQTETVTGSHGEE